MGNFSKLGQLSYNFFKHSLFSTEINKSDHGWSFDSWEPGFLFSFETKFHRSVGNSEFAEYD